MYIYIKLIYTHIYYLIHRSIGVLFIRFVFCLQESGGQNYASFHVMNTWEFGKATEKALHDNACTDVFTTISLTEFFSVSFFISTVKLLGQIKPRSMVVKHTSSQGKGKITFHTYADK